MALPPPVSRSVGVQFTRSKQSNTRQTRRTGAKQVGPKQRPALTENQVKDFLATFKTSECTTEGNHDPRICKAFHDAAKDRRRNPYIDYYEPDDCLNKFEEMYHPAIFRTAFCNNGEQQCIFGDLCSHAHSANDLRDRSAANAAFESLPIVESRPLPQMATFLPFPPERKQREYFSECASLWKELHLKTKQSFFALDPERWFLVNSSEALFFEIEEVAFEEGLGCVKKHCLAGQSGLLLKGLHLESIKILIDSLFDPPSRHFALEERQYGERVVSSLSTLLQSSKGQRMITTSAKVLIQTYEGHKIRVIAASSKVGPSGEILVREVLEKIDFWVQQEGYGDFVECGCCCDRRNPDQGVVCSNGHFYCSVERCFETAISAQILHLRTRDDGLICPECSAQYQMQEIAKHLPGSIWDDIQKALIDKKVERQYEALSNEFNARLEAKVQELIANYGSASEQLKAEAQGHALDVRNTILNLSCPHCHIAYAEFTGCMALECQSCSGNFCAYCHRPFENSRGTHEHVRQCLMNETTNSSYYADPGEIVNAQRRYRTRELRKYLRKLKKAVQNAIVIELERDLADLDIKPAALFEFGNLQDDM